jgi:hypothetical protein
MANRIIYSTLCALDDAPAEQCAQIRAMASLWAAHLRGPGRFEGRLIVLTNLPDLEIPGAECLTAPFEVASRPHLFLERVRQYRRVPVGPDDQVMQLDLDALAMAPVHALFDAIRPATLMAAQSGLPPLAHEQAGNLMTRPERWRYRVRGWYRRPGVSACVTVCNGADWPRLMECWVQAIDERGNGRPVPLLGDQSFLNLLFLTGHAKVRRLPKSLVYHVRKPDLPMDHPLATQATILHFPLKDRLPVMQRWSARAGLDTT